MSALSTLANVKAYLVITTTGMDLLIPQLIARETSLVEQWTGRTFPTKSLSGKRLSGFGGPTLILPAGPIISVSELSIDGTSVPRSSGFGVYGYDFEPGDDKLYMTGGVFTRGRLNVECSWVSGYRASEDFTVPSGNTPTLTPSLYGRADSVVSVTSDVGAAFTAVSNAPVAGQYSFSAGTLTFNSADSGIDVTVVHDYVPGAVEQACIELVGLDLKQRDNLGIASKSLAGENVTYTDKGMSASVKELLQPFKRVAPP